MFTKSEKFREEYCAQVVKINRIEPIENSDFLVKAIVGEGGYQVVISKDSCQVGDVMIYAKIGTRLSRQFLSVNNQFELSERQLNKNYEEVQSLIDDGKREEAKKLVGYFDKHGRVRIVKLRGCYSEGVLFPIESLLKWKPKVKDFDFEKCFVPGQDGIVEPFNFDEIDGDRFIAVFVPIVKKAPERLTKEQKVKKKFQKKMARFDRMVTGQFAEHYDTNMLRDNIWRLKPDTVVTISVKMHGTSHIVGNLLVKSPKGQVTEWEIKKIREKIRNIKKLESRFYWQRKVNENRIERLKKKIKSMYNFKYGNVTSSRRVIRNRYINKGVRRNFYSRDIFLLYGNLLYPYLPEGITLYSEICGFIDGTAQPVQVTKKTKIPFDYGCDTGESFIMPYRITFTDADGNKTDWEVMEVYGWTLQLLKDHPQLKDKVKPIPILYHGTLGDLYPDIPVDMHWHENILEAMANDVEHFGMELDEPLCFNKVPREGIVLRIDNDEKPEAFKLKTKKFREDEDKANETGEFDLETMEGYGDDN